MYLEPIDYSSQMRPVVGGGVKNKRSRIAQKKRRKRETRGFDYNRKKKMHLRRFKKMKHQQHGTKARQTQTKKYTHTAQTQNTRTERFHQKPKTNRRFFTRTLKSEIRDGIKKNIDNNNRTPKRYQIIMRKTKPSPT